MPIKKPIDLKELENNINQGEETLQTVVGWINWEAQKQICHLNTLFRKLESGDGDDELILEIEKTKKTLDELNLRGLKENKEIEKVNAKKQQFCQLKEKQILRGVADKINTLYKKKS